MKVTKDNIIDIILGKIEIDASDFVIRDVMDILGEPLYFNIYHEYHKRVLSYTINNMISITFDHDYSKNELNIKKDSSAKLTDAEICNLLEIKIKEVENANKS